MMMENMSVVVNELCIDYKNLSHVSIHQMLSRNALKRADVVHAVKGISFQVANGEILGIVGKNGSGKSTLLKAIAGIFQPDSGSIDTGGKQVSLMAIGIGFKADITGRENIMTSAMLQGFTVEEIKKRMDKIIEFSELGEFIDKPVRTYSSGMYSKLAFSISAILESEIILIDEVLSVGDEHFKKKSFEKMQSLILDRDRTVLIVSHSLDTIEKLCNRVMWLDQGIIKMIGTPQEVLPQYLEYMNI